MELRKFVLFARHRSMCLLGDQSFSLKKKKKRESSGKSGIYDEETVYH